MKKNLRIVSAAAAALLAVAPVAASAVSTVSADANTNIVLGGTTAPAVKGDVNVTSNVQAITSPQTTTIDNQTGAVTYSNWDGKVNGTVTATYNGQSYTATLNETAGKENSKVTPWYTQDGGKTWKVLPKDGDVYRLEPAGKYQLSVNNVSFNFGPANANKKNITLTSSNGVQFRENGHWKDTIKVSTDQNGAVSQPLTLLIPITPVDVTNAKSVSFYEIANGNEVHTGSLNMTANPTSHELNVSAVLAAAKAKYAAHQLENGASNGASVAVTTDVKDLTDQLTKAGIKVDPLGNFQAQASFSFNLAAKSAQNAATATLPITVSVANAAQTPAAQETTKNVTIMHISTIYDKTGKATNEPALRAYDTVSVVSDPVTINNAKFYKLAGKDQYIKVGNVDGTSRTLKHNSYVYKSSGKRANKKTLKKGSSVTTYGKSFMIAGHQMYRIGKNQYVKKANF